MRGKTKYTNPESRTDVKPWGISRARAFAEAAGRVDTVIASYRVRDDGTACAQLSWAEYTVEQVKTVLADLERLERMVRREP
ncbi:MAG: hypothetical protein ACE15E_01180 [Acidobacteriota bacterium]